MNYGDPRLRAMLASEYVLGTLHGRARRRFERLLGEDAGLRVTVEAWQNRLTPLAEALPPVEPPARVWKEIQLRLGIRETPLRDRLWNRLEFWRPFALATSALAAALLIYVGVALRPQAPEVTPQVPYIAVLSDNEARPAWVASGVGPDAMVVRSLATPSIPTGKTLELWVIPGKGQAPRSLGLLPETGSRAVALPEEIRRALTSSAALAISLEPAGGSPTRLPTGPVLYQGAWSPTGAARAPS
jgi:anti-sigma-K factor RskA